MNTDWNSRQRVHARVNRAASREGAVVVVHSDVESPPGESYPRWKQTQLPMEIVGTVTNLLREKESSLWSIEPDATVYQAIKLMADRNIGAVPVVQNGKLLGIISERDYTRNVILKGKSSRNALVREIMTEEFVTVVPGDSVGECMRIVTDKRVRYLPVVENGQLVGILSIGDLVKWTISAQTATIDQLTKYIYGE